MDSKTTENSPLERTEVERKAVFDAILKRERDPAHVRNLSAIKDLDELIEKAEKRAEDSTKCDDHESSDSVSEIEPNSELEDLKKVRKKMRGDLADIAPPEPQASPVVTGQAGGDVPAKKSRATKLSIEDVALEYLRTEYKSAQFASAAKFHKHLCTTAGKEKSPFEMGKGINARKLFCPEAGSFFDPGTLGNLMPKIRA